MWCQQQENKGRRKAESVINWAKDAGMRLGKRRWGGEGEGGAGHAGRGGRCGNIRTEESWQRQPAQNCSKSKSADLFSHHGRNGGMQVGVGIGLPAEPRSKEATGLERHCICSAQQDIAFGVTGQALCQQSGL